MRFRVKNIRNGYCEVWANERDGQRYQRLACVMRDKMEAIKERLETFE